MADRSRDKGGSEPRAAGAARQSEGGESVADYAKREMAEIADRERKKQVFLEAQARIAVELPARFFALAEKVRSEVDTFNKIIDPTRRISLRESAGLAARADHTRAELNLTVSRKGAEAWIGLSELMRLGRAPTAYIVEARITLTRARVRVRVDGLPKDGEVRYRVTIDGKEGPIGLDELPSRIVLAIAKDDPTVLGATPDAV